MAYGTAITLLVGAVGVTQLIRDGVGVTHEEARLASAGSAHHHEAGSKAPPSPLNMSVEARHLGGMLVDIRADVSMNKSASALTGAKVVAYTDMAEMPGAHKQGPLPLTETPGKPGIYETQGHMPMPGKYKVRVVVTKPIRDVEQTTVSVGTMY